MAQWLGDEAETARRASAWFRVPSPGADWLASVEWLLILSAYLSYLTQHRLSDWPAWALWTVVIGLFTLSEWTESWFLKHNLGVGYIVLRVLLAAVAVWLADLGFLATFLFFVVVGRGWMINRQLGLFASASSALLALFVTYLVVGSSRPDEYVHLVSWLAGLVFVAGTSFLAKREAEARQRSEVLLVELQTAYQQMQRYAEQVEELATTRERNRLAREIHDSLGHYLTIINVQLESALAWRDRDQQRADTAVSEAKRLASEALTDVRRSVAALRPTALEQQSIPVAITTQVQDFQAHSGLSVDLTIDGDEQQCSQAVGLVLYRVVQEGLTNIRKHADARQVTVQLHFGPVTTELTIADDGRGLAANRPAATGGGGFGLQGLRERVALLGGTLDWQPGVSGGMLLRATLPVQSRVSAGL